MKIESGRGIASATPTRRAGASAATGFAANESPSRVVAPAPASAAHSLDAILALQAEGMDAERRARQVRRGKRALDALDGLERALLLGRAPGGLRAELESLRGGAETTGEIELDQVLLEIDTRVAVELAKLDMNAPSP
ncbi:MAG TPA: flagellar assembly protein FliX [Caulobacterales bacterium]|nr:flagellar assembly protein FliX [Caulobacterales bacterium]